tara:strand:+ start:5235 stop:5501 length:267 start_codon:yes stop_codon:yes gene_type:complete
MRTSTSKGYNKIQVENKGFALWLNTEDSVEAEGGSSNKKVKFDINQTEIEGMSSASGDLTIALREVDYCDKDGNEFKILVLCSEPYTT